MGFSGGGKGNSSTATTSKTDVTNQQVATESGLAIGANSNARISIQSVDPEVVKTTAAVNALAINSIENVAGTSILANSNLAGKFIDKSTDLFAGGLGLLQSVNQEQTDVALRSQDLASRALDQSFAVSRSVAPQDPNYAQETLANTNSKTLIYIVLGIAAILFGGFFFFKKRA